MVTFLFSAFQLISGKSCRRYCDFDCTSDEAAMARCSGDDCQCWPVGKTGGRINKILKSCKLINYNY